MPAAAEPDWENLRVFAALHRHRSFSAAAKVVRVDATTLSRRLTQLEEQLGALLFQRTTAGLVPTDAATAIAERVARIERQVQLVRDEATGTSARAEGVVRLALTEELAASYLVPQLGPLRAAHPGIALELLVGDAYVDLSRGDADLAVRFQLPGKGAPADPRAIVDVTAKKLGAIEVAVYATRGYLARAGRPRGPYDVDDHDLVLARGDAPLPGAPWFARVRGRGRAVLRTDGLASMRAAIVAGMGLGALATFYESRHPELERIGTEIVDRRDAWLLMPTDLARVARTRAVWDHLVALFSSEHAPTRPRRTRR